MTMRLAACAAILAAALGCAPRGPIVGAEKPAGVGGTIAGSVTTNDGATPLSARKVTAVNVETGARFDGSTATNGGYTIKVPKGTYRLEIELHAGEVLARQPDQTDVNTGDLDAGRDFAVVVAATQNTKTD